ncbi:centromere/microtubule-binding protein cbf5 [Colletotrichum higginsianum]|uniref:Derlin n=3 Tax=Colletotrichum destructivum species complex TaxID=2707350 RepID=H1W485_COLHI|nr:Centromere/microtubule-binding protein cbf5 [Colletotrichum higginsianum IMI 349063]TIC99063.1 Derlin-2 [Colletotrichum higginsianum]WQF79800.1 Putative derlin, Rhomboid-like superfamily [Colletotrichum destructivum]OBR11979.1 Centromere/microtubule-binding protein cbf5 [Colletotrichum higginsianum IMI 349063]CCF47298.1 centromere/microtubule-binding protein cbf5 [Colletotrichum higginsianum]GJC93654.1 centromere/microtubule-binding protein cbf5 [Colletotrichum higginsianum]
MSEFLDVYWQAPPVARTFATAAFVTSLSVLLGIVKAYWFIFLPDFLFQFPPQIWRFGTNFLLTGPQLGLLFDTYFLYTYLTALEIGNPRFARREDVIWYLMFVCTVITALCTYLMGGGAFLPALILAMCRTVTQDQRGMKANFYFVTIPAQLTPFCMMLVSLLFPGGYYTFMIQLMGFIAAHLYDFLSRVWPEFSGGRNLIPTPAFLSRLVQTPRFNQRGYGTAVRGGGGAPAQTSGSSTGVSQGGGGVLPDSWRTRGPGRRLG